MKKDWDTFCIDLFLCEEGFWMKDEDDLGSIPREIDQSLDEEGEGASLEFICMIRTTVAFLKKAIQKYFKIIECELVLTSFNHRSGEVTMKFFSEEEESHIVTIHPLEYLCSKRRNTWEGQILLTVVSDYYYCLEDEWLGPH